MKRLIVLITIGLAVMFLCISCQNSSQTDVLSFSVNGVTFNMIKVKGGTFKMGATPEQHEAYTDELPVHDVTLSDYYIGETEVTQALWEAVMGISLQDYRNQRQQKIDEEERRYRASNPNGVYFNWGLFDIEIGAYYPVCDLDWNEWQEFISGLNKLTGQRFKLPTEAQWEYAARGGKKSQGYKYSGSNAVGNVAWCKENSQGKRAHPVATKQPNELGIYDMSGNVQEWCSDWFGAYSSNTQTNPTGPSYGSERVVRGGATVWEARLARITTRSGGVQPHLTGLRLAL